MTTQSQPTQTTSIHPATEVGLLSLTVADVQRSIAFYSEALGFDVLQQDASEATLGAAQRVVVRLRHPQGHRPAEFGRPGRIFFPPRPRPRRLG